MNTTNLCALRLVASAESCAELPAQTAWPRGDAPGQTYRVVGLDEHNDEVELGHVEARRLLLAPRGAAAARKEGGPHERAQGLDETLPGPHEACELQDEAVQCFAAAADCDSVVLVACEGFIDEDWGPHALHLVARRHPGALLVCRVGGLTTWRSTREFTRAVQQAAVLRLMGFERMGASCYFSLNVASNLQPLPASLDCLMQVEAG